MSRTKHSGAEAVARLTIQRHKPMITTILCIQHDSNYLKIPGLDLWDKERNALNYKGNEPIIAHPPCAQWSKLKGFAIPDPEAINVAIYCTELVMKNGGILEQPAYSTLFKYMGIKPTLSVNQRWWGFRAEKPTWLYFNQVEPRRLQLKFDATETTVTNMDKGERAKMPLEFCKWLTNHKHVPIP